MRRCVGIGLPVLLVLLLVPLHAAAQVTLRLALADDKTPAEELAELFAPFQAEHPEIQLEILPLYGNDLDRLVVELAGGVAADIFTTYNEAAVISMRRGLNLNLTPYVERDGFEDVIQDLLPASISQMSMDGQLYGLPQYQAVGGIYYNTHMFSEAGLPTPDGSWDWEGFFEAVRRLTRFEGGEVRVSGFTQYPQWIWFFPWLVQAGVSFEDPAAVPFDHPSAVRIVEELQQWVRQGYMMWDWPGPFLEERSAMTHSGSWELKYWVNSGTPFGVTGPPAGPAGRATLANTDIIAINRGTQYPEEAWTFLKWFYSLDVQRRYLEMFGLQPARLSLVPDWIASVNALYASHGAPEVPGLEAFLVNSQFASPQPFFIDPAVIKDDINPTLQRIFTQDVAAGPTLRAMSDVIRAKFAERLAETQGAP